MLTLPCRSMRTKAFGAKRVASSAAAAVGAFPPPTDHQSATDGCARFKD